MKKTLSYLNKSKKEAILAPIFKMLEVIFELLVPIIVSLIINNGIKNGYDADTKYIIVMCVILFVFAVLGLISSVTAQYFAAVASSKIQKELRIALFDKIQSLQYNELDKEGTSTLITRISNDVNQVQTGVNMSLRLLLRSPIVIIGAVIVAFFFSKNAGIVFLITVPLMFILIMIIMLISIPLFKKSQQKIDVIVRNARENLDGVRVIRAFNREEFEIENFKKRNFDTKKYQLFVGRISNIINPLTYALINVFIIILIYIGAISVNSGTLKNGDVVALYNLASQILVEMIKFATLLVTISKSIASMNRVEQILNLESNLKHESEIKIDSNNLFDVKNISMSYQNGKNVLNNITFSVKRGQKIGIIGGTGSGKSTLINTLCHFYDVSNGVIYYKGKNINSYDLRTLREEIAIVPQKAKLFKGTIRSNVLFGSSKEYSDKEILEVLSLAEARDIINKKQFGLDEEVEQDGRNFSGGQKQRLCIARALLKDSEIIIFDDSSSALDYQTDSKLRKNISSLKNKTIFYISQRTSSIQNCDQIIVLDEGRLIDMGTHDELLNRCKIYQEIYYSQDHKEKKYE